MPYRVETDSPCANACDVEVLPDADPPEIRFASDPKSGPEALWFYFRVAADDDVSGERLRLTWKHTDNLLGMRRLETARPVWWTAEADWRRLGAPEAIETPDGRHEASWIVDAPKGRGELAFCYPYAEPEIDALLAETAGAWQAATIGVSQAARPIRRLANDWGESGGTCPGVYLTARQHSGETPGSWVLDGCLRRLAEMGDRAPLVWVVPLTNIDGVVAGAYGKDNFPWDLNRAWQHPPTGQPMRHETLLMERDIFRWRGRCRPVLVLDFHAPGGHEDCGAYLYAPDPAKAQPTVVAEAKRWSDAIAEAVGPELMAENYARVADYPSRFAEYGRTSIRHFTQRLGVCGLCLETPYAIARDTVLERETYRRLGARVADGIVAGLAGD